METLIKLLTKPIVYFLLLNLSLSSCIITDDDSFDFDACLKGKGDLEKEQRSVRDFTGIELKLPATVYLKQGNTTKVEVEAKENLLPYIDTRVSGNNLIIDTDGCFKSGQDITIYVTVPEIRKVTVNSSGKIIDDGNLQAENLDLSVSGSGDIDLAVNAEDIRSKVLGSGSIILSGQADTHQIHISGSGKVDAFNLPTNVTEASIAGSGKALVQVNDNLDVSISGSGEVRYKGNPQVQKNISGSGRVVNAN